MNSDPVTEHSAEVDAAGERRSHVGRSRQYWRDVILGVNDGLVSTFLLVAGVVGGGMATGNILLTAVAGAVAGAVSMAASEFLATQSQEQVFDRETALEQEHIQHSRNDEVGQMRGFLEGLGVADEDLEPALAALTKDDQTLLNAMKVFEFGIVDTQRRSPLFAMTMSGLLFVVGAIPPTLPFALVSTPGPGLAWAAVATSIGLFAVGAAKTRVTDANPTISGLQNLAIAGVGGFAAYGIGSLVEAIIA